MTVTDPDVPDPLNDPRTLQADPGAVAEGEDLASTEDDDVASGADELAGQDPAADGDVPGGDRAGGDGAGGGVALLPGDPMAPEKDAPDDLTGDDVTGGSAGT